MLNAKELEPVVVAAAVEELHQSRTEAIFQHQAKMESMNTEVLSKQTVDFENEFVVDHFIFSKYIKVTDETN